MLAIASAVATAFATAFEAAVAVTDALYMTTCITLQMRSLSCRLP